MLPKEFDTSQKTILFDQRLNAYKVNPALDPTKRGSSSIQRLMFNQRYEVQVNLPDGQAVSIGFTSAYDPLYTSVEIIRQDLGEIADDLSDDEINFKIYQTGLMAQELAGEAQRLVLMGSPIGNIQLQWQGINKDARRNAFPFPTPFYVGQYVRFKVELEIAYARYISMSVQSGMTEKDLGDFKVIRQVIMPRIAEIVSYLKKNLEEWEHEIRGGSEGRARRTVRGRQNQYTITRTGRF